MHNFIFSSVPFCYSYLFLCYFRRTCKLIPQGKQSNSVTVFCIERLAEIFLFFSFALVNIILLSPHEVCWVSPIIFCVSWPAFMLLLDRVNSIINQNHFILGGFRNLATHVLVYLCSSVTPVSSGPSPTSAPQKLMQQSWCRLFGRWWTS